MPPTQFEKRQYQALYYGQWEEWVRDYGSAWNRDIEREYRVWSGIQRPLTDPGEITQYIREFLWSHATYSLTPGMMPLGEEVAEYFLFEGGQGYCQHFATAATLL